MDKEILSARQCGKTLESWFDFIKQAENMKADNYVLYINKEFYDKYKDKINLIDCEIEVITNLPKNINAVYMKKVDWRYTDWYENNN